jgi:mRNA-degrading endonuclease toxin of MazEF toxin-antitoxin module
MDLVNRPRRDEVWPVSLDPTHGSEIQKTRPCLVVSPNEASEYLRTVIIAPMTTTERPIRHVSALRSKADGAKRHSIKSGQWTGNVWFASLAPPRQKPHELSLRC